MGDRDGNVPAGKNIVDLVKESDGKIFNLAAQIFNHSFYWESMSADGGECAKDLAVAKQIATDFESFEKFAEQFTSRAGGHFGSGWVWLSLNADKKLVITDGHDAFCPLKDGLSPVLCITSGSTRIISIKRTTADSISRTS